MTGRWGDGVKEVMTSNVSPSPRPLVSPSQKSAIALTALYVAARLWRLTASCLWFDEIFSVHAARHPWGGP